MGGDTMHLSAEDVDAGRLLPRPSPRTGRSPQSRCLASTPEPECNSDDVVVAEPARFAALKGLTLLGAGALVLMMFAAALRAQPHVGRMGKTLRLAAASEAACLSGELKMDFGGGVTAIDIGEGSGIQILPCPTGSRHVSGKVTVKCADIGLWSLVDQTCFACGARSDTFKYTEDQEQAIHLKPGLDGEYIREKCRFKDGTSFEWGSVVYKCQDSTWKHVETTCSHHRCQAGNVTLDFYGEVGKVHIPVKSGSGETSLACPKGSPSPDGAVDLECGKVPDGEDIAKWRFLRQSCQVCNPTSMLVTLAETHTKHVDLPAGNLHDEKELECKFDKGAKTYKEGKLSYRCFDAGWKLYKSTCEDYRCPNETATISMQYTLKGETMTGRSQIKLIQAEPGTYEFPCPQGALDPKGHMVFECLANSSWKLHQVDCGSVVSIAH